MFRRILIVPIALLLAMSGGLAVRATPTPVPVPLCNGIPATIFGFSGRIWGSYGPDVIVGSSQADIIIGRSGADVICGGDGNDTIDGGPDNDLLDGEGGDDLVQGGDDQDVLTDLVAPGYVCQVALSGAVSCSGSQRLEGGRGDDEITGVGDLFGNTGNDTIVVEVGNANGGSGNDKMLTTTMPRFVDGPVFHGGDGDDVINADSGGDSFQTEVYGDAGTDTCNSDANDSESGCEI